MQKIAIIKTTGFGTPDGQMFQDFTQALNHGTLISLRALANTESRAIGSPAINPEHFAAFAAKHADKLLDILKEARDKKNRHEANQKRKTK